MSKSRKRIKDLNRDDYWMAVAFVMAAGSTGKINSCLVVGSNGELLSSACENTSRNSKYTFNPVISALFNCKNAVGSTVYVTCTPCYESFMALINANVKKIVYFSTKSLEEDVLDAAKGCTLIEEFKGNLNWVRDYFKYADDF
jgi:tRNA(Arg) A34 adenosine deaminase TadA